MTNLRISLSMMKVPANHYARVWRCSPSGVVWSSVSLRCSFALTSFWPSAAAHHLSEAVRNNDGKQTQPEYETAQPNSPSGTAMEVFDSIRPSGKQKTMRSTSAHFVNHNALNEFVCWRMRPFSDLRVQCR
jgi:hypothetical protein